MNPSTLDLLNFLLKLQACRGYRAYLSHPSFKSFQAKDKICQRLEQDGLVDFSREIVAVKPSAAGQALLNVAEPPVSEPELKLLKKIATAEKISPSRLTSSLPAVQRDALLQSFLNRGLIEAETRLKRERAEVWLTPQGQACLAELLQQFQAFRQRPDQSFSRPSDSEVLDLIQMLDREQGSQNYLPLFHLRQKLSFLPPAELDEILYRLQQTDQIELRAIAHTAAYSPEQLSAAIQTRTGTLLFFIKVLSA